MTHVRKVFVTYFISAVLDPKELVKEVMNRDIDEAKRALPRNAFGFQFHDRLFAEVKIEGQTIKLSSEFFNPSVIYYCDVEVVTVDDIKKLSKPTTQIGQKSEKLIRLKSGKIIPFIQDSIFI